MVFAVDERHTDVDQWVSSTRTVVHRVLDPLLNRGDELGRDRAAPDLVDEVKALARGRLDVDVDDAVLARAAGLTHQASLDLLGRASDCLPVRDLGPADVGVDLVLAQ